MKEIKAYIRRGKAAAVVEALRRGDVSGITLLEVHAAGYGEEPDYCVRSEDVFSRYHLQMVKLEVVCRDGEADRIAGFVADAARTGDRGDGVIFVSEVSRAVRIRDGASGDAAL